MALFRSMSWVIAGCALMACGGTQVSAELASARDAYAKAEASPAKKLEPDQLLTAKQALDRAEDANADDSGSLWATTLAYVAERKANLAVAYANISVAVKKEKEASAALEEALRVGGDRARKSLAATEEDLAKARAALEAREKALAEKQAALEDKQVALDQEHAARLDAEKRAKAAVASLQQIAQVAEDQRGTVITLSGSVLFKTGKADLLPIAEQQLAQVAKALVQQDESRMIIVEGYTDSRGSTRHNEQLSLARAAAVRAYLISQSVSPDRISAVGKGESDPVASNRTAEGRANNRRVEIVVQPAGTAPSS
ncbi:MAG TPA: OmpA family protein [Kofleriaceae bacterium]|nr:OmpA family protein [Kofleriaceae bacterium]